jgi:hypothetical protein
MHFRFELIPAYLSIAGGAYYRGRAFLGPMPEIVGDFFQCPASRTDPMREIMAEVMKGEITD